MRIVLVRHAQTTSNVSHALDTEEPGAELTKFGALQAKAAARELSVLKASVLYASNLLRTQQTAAPLAARLRVPINIHAGLREARAGDIEMRTDKESVRTYLKTYLAWINGDLAVRMPGGESGTEVVERVDAALADMVSGGDEVGVAFSHGATIRTWCAARVADLDADFVAMNPLDNCGSVFLVRLPGSGSWAVEKWHDKAIGGLAVEDPHDPAAQAPKRLQDKR